MKSSSRVPTKLGGVLVGLAVLCSSSQHVRGVETTAIKASSRLVSVEPMAGEMCALPVDAAYTGPLHGARRHSGQSGDGSAWDERQGAPAAGSSAAAGRSWRPAGVHDGAGGAAAGAAGGDQRGEAYGGTGAPATPAHLRSLSAVQRRGGRSGERRGRAAGREPVPDPGLQPDGQHAARRRRFRSRRGRSGARRRIWSSIARSTSTRRPATSTRSTTTPSGA